MAETFPTPKTPNETLDYGIDWSTRLDSGDTILTALFSLVPDDDSGAVILSQGFTDTIATFWLSEGIAGKSAQLLCVVTTVRNRVRRLTTKVKISHSK